MPALAPPKTIACSAPIGSARLGSDGVEEIRHVSDPAVESGCVGFGRGGLPVNDDGPGPAARVRRCGIDRFGVGRVDRERLAKTLPKNAAIYVQGPGPRAARAARLLQGMGFPAQPLRANWGDFLDAGFDTVP